MTTSINHLGFLLLLYMQYCSIRTFIKNDFPDPEGPKTNLFLLLMRLVCIGRSAGSILTGIPCLSVSLIWKLLSSSRTVLSLKKKQRAASEVVRKKS